MNNSVAASTVNRPVVKERQQVLRGHVGFARDMPEERPLRIRLPHDSRAPPVMHTTMIRPQ
jgi:hypothetical protein